MAMQGSGMLSTLARDREARVYNSGPWRCSPPPSYTRSLSRFLSLPLARPLYDSISLSLSLLQTLNTKPSEEGLAFKV